LYNLEFLCVYPGENGLSQGHGEVWHFVGPRGREPCVLLIGNRCGPCPAKIAPIIWKRFQLVYKCLNDSGPAYLADSLQRVTDVQSRRRLWSFSSSALVIPMTHRATLGDHSFPVAATRTWNALPDLPVFTDFLTPTTHITV